MHLSLLLLLLSIVFGLVFFSILFPRICPQLATLIAEVFVVGFYVSGPFVRKKFVQRDFRVASCCALIPPKFSSFLTQSTPSLYGTLCLCRPYPVRLYILWCQKGQGFTQWKQPIVSEANRMHQSSTLYILWCQKGQGFTHF